MAGQTQQTQASGSGSRTQQQGQQQQDRGTIYNPRQDASEKRKVRQAYRDLIKQSEDMRTDLGTGAGDSQAGGATQAHQKDFEVLNQHLDTANDIYKKVRAPAEGVLDSRVLLNVGDMGRRMANSLRTEGSGFDMDEFLNRVALYVGSAGARLTGGRPNAAPSASRKRKGKGRAADDDDEDEDDDDEEQDELAGADDWQWLKLGRLASKHTRRAPTMDFMLGPLKSDYKKRTVAKRIKIDRSGPVERPDELTEADIEKNQQETTKMIMQVSDLLTAHPSVPMFDFVLDPTSFGNSVENLFYVSFLIRDGRCAVIMPGEEDNEDGEQPLLMACQPPDASDYSRGLDKRQLIFEFDMDVWQGLIKEYDIQESIIPPRKHKQRNKGAKWYV